MAETDRKNCSKCGGEIQPCVYFGIELESCQNCGGFFLDSKRIQKTIALTQFDAENSEKRKDQSSLSQASMVCPKCQCSMAKRSHKKRKAIALDVCPSCQGIWFDAGEYAKYCGMDVKEKAERREVLEVHLHCEACNTASVKPGKERNVCQRCGNRLNLVLGAASAPPFWYRNHWCAALLFTVGMATIYFVALKSLGNLFQAIVLSIAVGPFCLIYIIRALIYNKFFYFGYGPFRGVDVDLDDPDSSVHPRD